RCSAEPSHCRNDHAACCRTIRTVSRHFRPRHVLLRHRFPPFRPRDRQRSFLVPAIRLIWLVQLRPAPSSFSLRSPRRPLPDRRPPPLIPPASPSESVSVSAWEQLSSVSVWVLVLAWELALALVSGWVSAWVWVSASVSVLAWLSASATEWPWAWL